MHRTFARLSYAAVLVAVACVAQCAFAQQEFPPPQGNGRVVVMLSGQSGPKHYEAVAKAVAKLGYDVTLFDGNQLRGKGSQAVIAAIEQARSMPHALPGKVALIGFSLGGGIALGIGSQMPDHVAVDIVWYPATVWLSQSPPGFAGRIKVPVLMFAGEWDDYRNCCLISTARALADSAAAAKAPFELITYPKIRHDFVLGGSNYDSKAYDDAFGRTAARLQAAFADTGATTP